MSRPLLLYFKAKNKEEKEMMMNYVRALSVGIKVGSYAAMSCLRRPPLGHPAAKLANFEDQLCCVYSRGYLNKVLHDLLSGSGEQFSLAMLDIDYFKRINDTYGHLVGDNVLVELSSMIKDFMQSHVVARFGGEEFCILLEKNDVQEAYQKTETLRRTIEKTSLAGIKLTVSGGLAGYPEHAQEQTDLIRKTDLSLYASKRNGRNQITIYSPALSM